MWAKFSAFLKAGWEKIEAKLENEMAVNIWMTVAVAIIIGLCLGSFFC